MADEERNSLQEAPPAEGAATPALIVRPRTGAVRRVPLPGRPLTVGRAKTADVVVKDPTISSIHLRIEPRPGGHRVVDCRSKNGTKVNGKPISTHDLAPGDEVQIGGAVLVYAVGEATAEAGEKPEKRVSARPPSPVAALVDGDTTTIIVAASDFDVDFLEPRTVSTERTEEAALERRLIGIYRAAKTLTPVAGEAPVERRFVKLVQDLLGAARVAILDVDPSGAAPPPAVPSPAVVAGEVRPPAPGFGEAPPEPVIVREVVRTGRALLYRRPSARAAEGGSTPASAIAVPLDVDGRPGLYAYSDVFEPVPPIHQDDLRLLGILARHAATCISNQRLQEALVAANRDLEERVERRSRELIDSSKLAAVGTLAAGVAHEFNNALAVIMGNAELGLQAAIPPDLREQLETILDAGRRTKEIVRQLLTFSRRRDPRKEPVSLVEIVEAMLRIAHSEISRAGAHLKRSFAALPPALGEAGQISYAFLSLLRNAIDAVAAKGGGDIRVGVRRRLPQDPGGEVQAVIEVADTGPGIPPEVRARLFEPFFTTKPVGKGTGLGLATAFGILRNHGGTIEVETEPDQGSTFRMVLPLAEPEVREEPLLDFGLDAAPSSSGEGALHVLVVDDDPAVRLTIGAMIRRLGHYATLVGAAEEALKLIDGARFDLVLADINMAGMDGIELRRRILDRIPEQKLVLVTGSSGVDDLLARQNIAGQAVLKKPIGLGDLGALLGRFAPK